MTPGLILQWQILKEKLSKWPSYGEKCCPKCDFLSYIEVFPSGFIFLRIFLLCLLYDTRPDYSMADDRWKFIKKCLQMVQNITLNMIDHHILQFFKNKINLLLIFLVSLLYNTSLDHSMADLGLNIITMFFLWCKMLLQ